MLSWIKLFRIKHWIKNLLLFVPIFFAGKITNIHLLIAVSWAFLAFSFCTSAHYIINDLKDLKYDRIHPQKRNRPLAKGEINKYAAIFCSILFLLLSIVLGTILGTQFILIIIFYLVLNLLYSFKIKNIPLVEVFSVSMGYILRIIGGGVAADIKISPWLFMSTFLLALYITFGKRFHELKILKERASQFRLSLTYYNDFFLISSLSITGTSALLMYAIYSVENGGLLVYTAIPAAYGVLRYLQIILKGEQGEPIEIFEKDIHLWITSGIFLLFISLAIYN